MTLHSRKNFSSERVIWLVENGKAGTALININLTVGSVSIFCKTVFSGADGYIKSNHAFIFTLKNLRGIAPFKMDLESDKSDHAATQSSTFGPIFGENDINVHSLPAGSAESFTSLNNSYKFPSSLALSIDERDSLLAGSKYFIVDDLEAFYYAGMAKNFILRKVINTKTDITIYLYHPESYFQRDWSKRVLVVTERAWTRLFFAGVHLYEWKLTKLRSLF